MARHNGPWGNPYNTYRVWQNVTYAQSIANNRTTFTIKAYLQDRYGYGLWDSNTRLRIRVRGTTVYDNTISVQFAGNGDSSHLLRTQTRNVTHNANGSLSSSAIDTLVETQSTGLYNGTASGSVSVPTIPRATVPSWSGSFTTGVAKSISLPRASSAFTHVVRWEAGDKSGTISNSAGTSVSWAPPHHLFDVFTNATSRSVRIYVRTRQGSTNIGSEQVATATVNLNANQVPVLTAIEWEDTNETVAQNIGALVQNLSHLRGTITATGSQGSPIASRTTMIDGVTVNAGSSVLIQSSGTVQRVAEATDQRGRTQSQTSSVNVLAYTPPMVNSHQVRRAYSNGSLADDGTYLRVDLNAGARSLIVASQQRNHLQIQVRTRPTGGAWTTRQTLNPGLTYNSYFLVSGGGVFSAFSSYDVELILTDNTGSEPTRVLTSVSTAQITMDLNGPNVGIGKAHEQGALDVGGVIYADGISLPGDTEWANIIMLTAFQHHTGGRVPQWRIKGGTLQLRGRVQRTAGGAIGTSFANLTATNRIPIGFRETDLVPVGESGVGETGLVRIDNLGRIQIASSATSIFLSCVIPGD